MTKHEQIIQYIEKMPIGNKISVRQISRNMKVSEGTAYRAIKEAEARGFVSAIERVGTVRIKKKERENIEKLTFAEVVNIVDGHVIAGMNGLHKQLNKFVIGAMQIEDMMRYVETGSLLIVGNRYQAHKLAIAQGASVLITGGFDTTAENIEMANSLSLPIISTSYDTFTVATMINRAIDDRLIKKEIITIEDIMDHNKSISYITSTDKLASWHELVEKTKHSRFPVVDENMRVVGMITSKDVLGKDLAEVVEKNMTKNPLTVNKNTSVAMAAHMMVWEGIELLPVVDEQNHLISVVTRQDIIESLQYRQKQPQVGETFEELITNNFNAHKVNGESYLFGEVTPQMTTPWGTLASGVLTTLITLAARQVLKQYRYSDMVVENITVYFIKPVAIESEIKIFPKVIEVSRKFAKIDVEVKHQEQIVSKAILTLQTIER